MSLNEKIDKTDQTAGGSICTELSKRSGKHERQTLAVRGTECLTTCESQTNQ